MRDQSGIFSEDKFDESICFYKNAVERIKQTLAEGVKNEDYAGQFAYEAFLYGLKYLRCMYSSGAPIADIRGYLPQVIQLLEWAYYEYETRYFPPEIMERRKRFRLNFDFYVEDALWFYSMALCLGADNRLLARLLRVIGNDGEDALFDRLVAQRFPGRTIGGQLLYPRIFQPLYDAIDAPEPKRSTLLVRYVSQWYGNMKRAHWHDTHLGKDGGEYCGYWCFEAAGVVKAFGLDDQALLDLPHYPKDLARG